MAWMASALYRNSSPTGRAGVAREFATEVEARTYAAQLRDTPGLHSVLCYPVQGYTSRGLDTGD